MAEMENEVAELRAKVAELEEERDRYIHQKVREKTLPIDVKTRNIRDLAQGLMQEVDLMWEEVEGKPEAEPKPKKARKTTAYCVYDREGHKVFCFKDVPCSNDDSLWWEANNIEAITGYDFFNDEEMVSGEMREEESVTDWVKRYIDDVIDEFEEQEPKIIHVETPDAGWYRQKITTYLF